ncbi:MAG: epoxyqueuosine reductase QueH [Endomicrobium sp.]|jgi:predicted adenine nucleotide alpha hydrolase (AANH) superfamily ATPase|uniref:epoxyqueuosine reductase QueH n=1 Tax=Candidatus Endomicrobiellum cubanum TaxID=3242325 RepID=UPI00282D98CB|nr:epoxyqueuosine reductase QueH [Endomicrobium sp.]
MNDSLKSKVLLHICCAPCSASSMKVLYNNYNVSFYWYNPNIWNFDEYKKRKDSVIKYAKELNIAFYEEQNFVYDYKNWIEQSLETCNLCYSLRLEKTVLFAKLNNFDFFTTSLLSSPYQRHGLIKQISKDLSLKYSLKFLYADFREFFYEGKNTLKQKGYYMQKYCACNKSYMERFEKK